MMPTDIATEVRRVVALELSVPMSALAPERLLVEDLGLDSLAAVRLLAAVEKRFGVELIGTDYVDIASVADLIAFVERHLGAGARP